MSVALHGIAYFFDVFAGAFPGIAAGVEEDACEEGDDGEDGKDLAEFHNGLLLYRRVTGRGPPG